MPTVCLFRNFGIKADAAASLIPFIRRYYDITGNRSPKR
jgi:hypothetical protein